MSEQEASATLGGPPDDTPWRLYDNGKRLPDGQTEWSVPGPPWRMFGSVPAPILSGSPAEMPVVFEPSDPPWQARDTQRAYYEASEEVINTVNLALRLRRPILVTGVPGTGKTTLAYSIAYQLGLGPVLEWLITSRSTLRDGLYQYDVLARVNDMNLANKATGTAAKDLKNKASNIGRYVTLGPLGDALLPRKRPRVLLIDEIDKCDIDLPGDLLHVFDRGSYEIPELVRETENSHVRVSRANTEKAERHVSIEDGRVTCAEFPVIVLTSNEERDFPPAFERRCLRIRLQPPEPEVLEKIVINRLGLPADGLNAAVRSMIERFASKDTEEGIGWDGRKRATSQLLNALYLRLKVKGLTDEDLAKLEEIVLAPLSE